MKSLIRKNFFIAVAGLIAFSITGTAQDLKDPGTYMTAMSNAQTAMNQTYMAYMSAAAHSTRAKKIENLRMKTLESINDARYKVVDLPIYKGDNSLRQSSIDYIKLCYSVFNEDYARIVNMGEIAEQSFDEMQALILLKEKTSEKISEASEKLNTAEKEFAAKYNVKIISEKNEFGEKMAKASKLNRYQDQVYLLFFKCNWQDGKITEAFNKGNLTNIEQSRNALINYSTEGLQSLDTIKHFQNDPSLARACREALNGYKKMAEIELPKMIDFYLKQDNFTKLEKAFGQKSDPSKDEVKAYNKSIDDMNAASKNFNQTNNNTNNMRSNIVNNWNNASKTYLDNHMPYYKK